MMPEIAVAPMDDAEGSWRIYRQDGVLLAAGALGTDIRGGLFLAAQDLNGTGRDTLFMGEAEGSRAWLAAADSAPAEIGQDILARGKGISALSVSSPVPSFFVISRFGGALAIVGDQRQNLAAWQVADKDGPDGWTSRRGLNARIGSVYDVSTAEGHTVFLQDALGLKAADSNQPVLRWVQVPQGEQRPGGWRYYETWPR
jgi:hypothetical protein